MTDLDLKKSLLVQEIESNRNLVRRELQGFRSECHPVALFSFLGQCASSWVGSLFTREPDASRRRSASFAGSLLPSLWNLLVSFWSSRRDRKSRPRGTPPPEED